MVLIGSNLDTFGSNTVCTVGCITYGMFHSRTDNNEITRKLRISIDMFTLTCQKFQVQDGIVVFGCV